MTTKTQDTFAVHITSRDHGILHHALTQYVAQLKDELNNTSDVSYAWSLLLQQLEAARDTAKTLRLKVE